MTQAAAQAAQFFEEVARGQTVWLLHGPSGYPTSRTPDGHAMPIWSSEARAQAIQVGVPSYKWFQPKSIPWAEFRDTWLPDLAQNGLRCGVNWSGRKATGYDFDPPTIRERVEAEVVRAHVTFADAG